MTSSEPLPRPIIAAIPVATGDEGPLLGTLRSLAASSVRPVQVLLVPREAAALQAARTATESPGLPVSIEIEPDGASLGSAIRRACKQGACDVVLLAAGAELPFAWDARLAKGAYAEPKFAAAIPLCDASPLHAVIPVENRHLAFARGAEIDRHVYALGARAYYEVPVLHAFCAYLRGDAIEALPPEVDEPGLDAAALVDRMARAWRAVGRATVLCDFIYVCADGSAPSAASVERSAFEMHSPLGALRRAVTEALERGLSPISVPALDGKPVLLHVMHFWGGGVDTWVREFARADDAHTHLLLATYRIGESGGQRIVLHADADAKAPLRTWDIARPLLSTAVSSLEYREILRQVVSAFDIEAIIVSSLIGHSLDALELPLPTLVVAHDFYPTCPNINPRFDETCPCCGLEDIARCMQRSAYRDVFGDKPAAEWQALRDAYVERLVSRHIEMVVPTRSVAATLQRLDPRLAAVPMRTIGHGIGFAAPRLAVPAVEAGERLRIAVVGRLNASKGVDLLRAVAPALARTADVHLVGCGPDAMDFAREAGWRAIERYTLDELPGLLASIAPHAALLASVVPETFSYTLSEMWTLGIPPIATSLGAFRERIRDGVDGFLFEPSPDALLRLLEELRSRPERLSAVAAALATRGPERTVRDMVADYSTMLPQGLRAVARFPVGIGRETALTEPYRQLQEAYRAVSAAYEELSAAYEQTGESYRHTRAEFERVHACFVNAQSEAERLRSVYDAYAGELQGLRVGTQWWHAPRAQRLLEEMHRKITASAPIPGAGDSLKTDP